MALNHACLPIPALPHLVPKHIVLYTAKTRGVNSYRIGALAF